jgi:predicted CopG family antitoxin
MTYMSTKTIAVDSRVYERLRAAKREGESFSKALDRLLSEVETAHTGSDILERLDAHPVLTPEDAEVFLGVIAEGRAGETWNDSDLS